MKGGLKRRGAAGKVKGTKKEKVLGLSLFFSIIN
jgi:hypothetical protein